LQGRVFTPDGKRQLLDIEFQHVRPGGRIVLLGKNGVGKSRTLECLMQALQVTDECVRFNPRLKLGVYDQELRNFDSALGRFDWLRKRSEVTDDRIKQVPLQSGITFSHLDRAVNVVFNSAKPRRMSISVRTSGVSWQAYGYHVLENEMLLVKYQLQPLIDVKLTEFTLALALSEILCHCLWKTHRFWTGTV